MIADAMRGILSILLLCMLSGASGAQDSFPNRPLRLNVTPSVAACQLSR